ncbi:MAG: hypothetical protein E7508_07745 [Ruminococcus sp.]|nr:hypothetical protein [Ruminococcus sp.]
MKTSENKSNERERFIKSVEAETPDKERIIAMYDDVCADREGLQRAFDRFIANVQRMCGDEVVKKCGSASALAEKEN